MKQIVGFKWTNKNRRSWQDGKFGQWAKGKTLSVPGATADGPCGVGIHVGKTAAAAIGYGKFPGRLYEVAGIGDVLGQDDTKWRFASVKVLRELEKPSWVTNTEAFIESIKTVKFFHGRRRKPLPEWKHHETWDAAGAAAGDAAGYAAGAAARAAAGYAAGYAAGAAARDAAGAAAGDAAGYAAGAAARDAAGAAAMAAAMAAAWDAAGDAALCALMEIVSDLKFKDAEKHRRHVRERWKVWQMGYGLVCDVDGSLYTYDKP